MSRSHSTSTCGPKDIGRCSTRGRDLGGPGGRQRGGAQRLLPQRARGAGRRVLAQRRLGSRAAALQHPPPHGVLHLVRSGRHGSTSAFARTPLVAMSLTETRTQFVAGAERAAQHWLAFWQAHSQELETLAPASGHALRALDLVRRRREHFRCGDRPGAGD